MTYRWIIGDSPIPVSAGTIKTSSAGQISPVESVERLEISTKLKKGTHTVFSATKEIIFSPGFETEAGATFEAKIKK